jgi:ATP-dependent Lon protease
MTTLETREQKQSASGSAKPEDRTENHAGPDLPPDALIIIPVRNMVLFPGMVVPVTMQRERSVAAAQEAARHQLNVGILLQRDPEQNEPEGKDLYEVGASAGVLRYLTGPDGRHHLVVQGQQRFRVREFLTGYP